VVKRRSFEDGLTADEEAFLKQGTAKPTAKIQKPKSPPKPQPKKEEPIMSKPAFKQPIAFEPAPVSVIKESVAPLKVSNLSVRIDSRISAALLRAMTERRIEGISPSTQQDIVAEAMVAWLKKNGYFQ
jgi:hypothetical protein